MEPYLNKQRGGSVGQNSDGNEGYGGIEARANIHYLPLLGPTKLPLLPTGAHWSEKRRRRKGTYGPRSITEIRMRLWGRPRQRPSALMKNSPLVLRSSDPHGEHDLAEAISKAFIIIHTEGVSTKPFQRCLQLVDNEIGGGELVWFADKPVGN